jgi:alkylation response protein AidB-like acyl-CoA dehydrogenase
MLAAVAATDLSLVKLYEGHTDAVAILDELGAAEPNGSWAVWAAEPPDAVAVYEGTNGSGCLSGRKAWCSGAGMVEHALVTARTPDGIRVLVHVPLSQPGIQHHAERWHAVGMAATQSGDVAFDSVLAVQVGAADAYLERPGFWQGGIGIAACWYGAACAVARTLRRSSRLRHDVHAQAHLGAVDTALFTARCALRHAADAVDAAPAADAGLLAARVRATVEAAATETLDRVGRALGAAPLCLDAVHAQRCTDLATFLRQSHAEADLQALGGRCAHGTAGWTL